MRRPESTYRLQFHSEFTFRDAAAIVDYLHRLGVTHCYASPYLKAVAGSKHGYDVIDHNSLNPEIGTEDDYNAWVSAMARVGMSHILDIVPNHVGVATNDNAWWNDVLEDGMASPYAHYFDIEWANPPRREMAGRVLIPILGSPYGQVLDKGELKLGHDEQGLAVHYYQRRLPLAMRSYARLLSHRGEELKECLPSSSRSLYASVVSGLNELNRGNGEGVNPRLRGEKREKVKKRFVTLLAESPEAREFIDRSLLDFNGSPGNSEGFNLLDEVLNEQNYRLAYWRIAAEEINYRRFFSITDLAALSMEREDVFQAAHALVMQLVFDGKVTGLRVDHPDGLLDPRQYFERLHATFESAPGGEGPLYVVAEKILAADEALPRDWRVDGTSGYDFLAKLNGLYVESASEKAMTNAYSDWVGDHTTYNILAYNKKNFMLRRWFAGDLKMLACRLDQIAQVHRATRDFTEAALLDGLAEIIACFPVYRTYIIRPEIRPEDRAYIETAVEQAIHRNPEIDPLAIDFIRNLLLLGPSHILDTHTAEALRFIGKFQQLTAPVTAKGVEDTTFYLYNRLVSLNEVGGDPGRFGLTPHALHGFLGDRQAHWPYAMSALSTHDTKRSEDVRARISVLSELPDAWLEHALRWREINAKHRQRAGGSDSPAPNDEYLIYQTLIGAWPLELRSPDDRRIFCERIQAYMVKAMREGKLRTSWEDPNQDYESAVTDFVGRLIDEAAGREFLCDFLPFQKRISHLGMLNSLSQTLVRITAPGIPDTYQGTELWDFSLVDPDNRRSVDYVHRDLLLRQLTERIDASPGARAGLAQELAARMDDSRVKLFLTWQSLLCRRRHPGLFSSGDYLPLKVEGSAREHVFAFLRRCGSQQALVIVPRLMARIIRSSGGLPVGRDVWRDTSIHLPPGENTMHFSQVFTGEKIVTSNHAGQSTIEVADLLADFPVALLLGE